MTAIEINKKTVTMWFNPLPFPSLSLPLPGVPFEVSLYWHQYPYMFGLAFCKIRALISEAYVRLLTIPRVLCEFANNPPSIHCRSTYVSVLTIVAFTMERFLAICHPLHLYTMSGFKRAIRIIAALWCISFLSALPFAVHTKIYYARYPLGECALFCWLCGGFSAKAASLRRMEY